VLEISNFSPLKRGLAFKILENPPSGEFYSLLRQSCPGGLHTFGNPGGPFFSGKKCPVTFLGKLKIGGNPVKIKNPSLGWGFPPPV